LSGRGFEVKRGASIQCKNKKRMNDLAGKISALRTNLREEYLAQHSWPWVLGFSGGKDSTLLAHFVVEMLKQIAPDDRLRPITFVSNNTLVESPVFQRYVDRQLKVLQSNLNALKLPISVVQTHPESKGSFWFNLIGKGYPAPSPSFRWCTNHMKVKPTVRFLQVQTDQYGGAILLLGIRRSESSQRAKTIAHHETNHSGENVRLTPHTDVADCHIFAPIKEFTTEEVWALLLQLRPPWGGSYRELIAMYRDAHTGECPFVVSENDNASCGTSNARFGCWTCTVVRKDRALDALAESREDEGLEKLAAFRVRIKQISDDPEQRSLVRRSGQPGLGPLTLEARRLLLDELLELQREVQRPLISEEEVCLIHNQWRTDETTDLVRSLSKRHRATALVNP
jgi:DNA sulfur modification protein DndC